MDAFNPEVQALMTSLLSEVVNGYDVAGVQGDDRLPAFPSMGGYNAATQAKYTKQFNTPPPANLKDPQWIFFALLLQNCQVHQTLHPVIFCYSYTLIHTQCQLRRR